MFWFSPTGATGVLTKPWRSNGLNICWWKFPARVQASSTDTPFQGLHQRHVVHCVPTVDHPAMQKSLEYSPSNALILLDCCMVVGTVGSPAKGELPWGGRTEIIATCGIKYSANNGHQSFANAFVKELRALERCSYSISVATLHRHILGRVHSCSLGRRRLSPKSGLHLVE